MMSPRTVNFLQAEPSDLPAVARLISSLNVNPTTECLHCPRASAVAVQAILRGENTFPGGWHHWFFKAVDADGNIVAVLGCQPDSLQTHGWLWGPWCSENALQNEMTPSLLNILRRMTPQSLTTVEAFLNVENEAGLKVLRSTGFALRIPTHIYTLTAKIPVSSRLGTLMPTEEIPGGKEGFPFLRSAHELAFLGLHASAFPAAPQTGQELLDSRDPSRVILAAADGLRLLGYVCVSINDTPREGFIDYLAVKPAARGRGVGRWLLGEALRWIFDDQRLPQAALCVTDWRDDARRLYKQAGFRLYATGIAARLHRSGR